MGGKVYTKKRKEERERLSERDQQIVTNIYVHFDKLPVAGVSHRVLVIRLYLRNSPDFGWCTVTVCITVRVTPLVTPRTRSGHQALTLPCLASPSPSPSPSPSHQVNLIHNIITSLLAHHQPLQLQRTHHPPPTTCFPHTAHCSLETL